MSFYLLQHERRDEGGRKALASLVGKAGFKAHDPVAIGPWRLMLFDNRGPSVVHGYSAADGSRRLHAIGLFLHRGLSGEAALASWHAAQMRGCDPYEGTGGHFTLIEERNGQLRLFCDGLGAHKIYRSEDGHSFSNSFLAALLACPARRFDPFAVAQYVATGACHGPRTLLDDIRALPANARLVCEEESRIERIAAPIATDGPYEDMTPEEAVAFCLAPLRAHFGALAQITGGRVRISFSGGYDSRLMLALLRETGITPELYVYGPERDIDVRIAQAVAAGEGLKLCHIDKGATPVPAPEAMPEILEQALICFDGWRSTGLFDDGSDAADRAGRHRDGFLPVNGGLGEIYRNFFNLFDRPYRARDIVNAFYRNYDPAWFGPAFDEAGYIAGTAQAMREQLGLAPASDSDIPLGPREVQLLYPLFRGRFWTAREAEINQRFGAMSFPYLEHDVIDRAGRVPLRHKNFGRLQAAMIRTVSPRLAGYKSAYGFSFDRPPSLGYRLDCLKSMLRPVGLRHRLRSLRKAGGTVHDGVLDKGHLAAVIDPDLPVLRRWFRPEAIDSRDAYNRVVTLEYLAERFSIAAA